MIYLIGSCPIAEDILGRSPKDVDVLCTLDEFKRLAGNQKVVLDDENHAHFNGERIHDAELIWPGRTSEALEGLIQRDPDTKYIKDLGMYAASLDILYMLKMSHRFKKNSPHFLKTMRDIQKMRNAGAKIRPEHEDFYKARMAETYWYSHPNLKREKSEFFRAEDDFYVFDHDSIHVTVALDPFVPAYTKYAVEGQEVLSSKQKFLAADEAVRLAGVYEETCVLALERSQIPSRFKTSPEWSFLKALEKVCTSITSGWFREYAWENYDRVVQLYRERGEDNYVWQFLKNKERLVPYESPRNMAKAA